MMPSSEVKREERFKVGMSQLVVTIQSGENGWTILYADSSSEYQDEVDTTDNNFDKAMKVLKTQFGDLINDYHESDNNGWIKIESENDLPITDGKTIQYFFVTKAGNITENGYCDLMKNKKIQYSLVYTHYQKIIKPKKPLY